MIHFFIGTKAQLIKVAPVILELDRRRIPYRLIDSGQHAEFTASLREDFAIRQPDAYSSGNGEDVATLSKGIRWLGAAVLRYATRRRWIANHVFGGQKGVCVVHGDTASTLVGALYARRAGLAVAHLEAGLRSNSYFNPFPEELIRVWCMRLSSLLFAPDEKAVGNLRRMGVRGEVVHTHGNTGLDALAIQAASGVSSGREPGSFALAACHRLETIKSRRRLSAVVDCLNRVARQRDVVLVVHKPTEKALRKFDLIDRLDPAVERLPMQPHSRFVALIRDAAFVMADGGSIQEECAALGVPLLVLRSRSERDDGLGKTAQLAAFDDDNVDHFLENLDAMRATPEPPRVSPSVIVADRLIEFDARMTTNSVTHSMIPDARARPVRRPESAA